MGWNSLETAKLLVSEGKLDADPEKLAEEKSALMTAQAEAKMPIMAGAAAAVDRLGEEIPFHLAVAAGRKRKLVDPALEPYKLGGKFDLVVTSDDRKPDDELDDLLASVAERLEVKQSQCAMVDDSRNGLLAAERAGMKTIAFDSHPKWKFDYAMADSAIKSLDELVPELINAVIAG